MEATCARYEKYYSEALTKNKSALTNGFKNREFQHLNLLISNNERLENAFFLTVCQMSKLHVEINRNSTSLGALNKIFNKYGTLLNTIAEEDAVPTITKQNVEIRHFRTIKLG